MSRLKGNRLFRSPQRRLPVAVLGLEKRLSLQHAEPGVLIRTWRFRVYQASPNPYCSCASERSTPFRSCRVRISLRDLGPPERHFRMVSGKFPQRFLPVRRANQ
jgi:hypothetical protein